MRLHLSPISIDALVLVEIGVGLERDWLFDAQPAVDGSAGLDDQVSTPPPALTDRFLAAVALAQEVHGHMRRSGTEIPYLAHLLVVAGLVLEDGGDEDQVIAAMLHDAVEDGGGQPMLERIERQFGSGVADDRACVVDLVSKRHAEDRLIVDLGQVREVAALARDPRLRLISPNLDRVGTRLDDRRDP